MSMWCVPIVVKPVVGKIICVNGRRIVPSFSELTALLYTFYASGTPSSLPFAEERSFSRIKNTRAKATTAQFLAPKMTYQ